MLQKVAKFGCALCLGIVGISLLEFRHVVFYSYHVDRPAEAQFTDEHPRLFVLAGLTCIGLAVALARGAYNSSLRRS